MHKFDLNHKTAVITGGAQGFGLDIAKKFLLSGAKVFIWDIDENELSKASKEINNQNLNHYVVDVSNFDQVQKAVTDITSKNKIDILINNAGITGPTAELWNYNIKDWNSIIDINLHGTFYCCKFFFKSVNIVNTVINSYTYCYCSNSYCHHIQRYS